MKPAVLRDSLPKAYYPFFGRHAMPRRIQLESAPPLLAGRDALILAPAASGKTEAFSAPLCERLLTERWAPPAIVVVSPTRALANDLHRRLEGPARDLGISLGRWTGERKERAGGGLPALVIVTPESLDSRISRATAALRSVRCAVLDELHVLDGSPRGDQLRILISRLRHLAGTLQVVASSATVADPEGVAHRYLKDAAIIRDMDRPVFRARIVRGRTPEVARREIERLARSGARKFLVFANNRDMVEEYAAALARLGPFRGHVYAHHGSLSKRTRERAEDGFLSAPRALCIATMTLELGIDIGDVDTVGLLDPPADVSGLLQRIGRSGRRGQGPRGLLFARAEAETFRYRTLLALAREGDLAADPPRFHPSVLVQQAMSILHQNPGAWISASAMHRRLDPELAAEWTAGRLEGLLAHLSEAGWLEAGGGRRYVEGLEAERRWARGTLHSNLSDARGTEVVDQLTADEIGRIASPRNEGKPGHLRMAGRDRRILWADEGRIVVGEGDGGSTPRFVPRGTPVTSRRLAQVHARRLGIADGDWPLIDFGSRACLYHFLGSAGGEVLAEAISAAPGGTGVVAAGPFALVLCNADVSEVPSVGLAELKGLCLARRQRLARVLGMGPFHGLLPRDEADLALCDAADLPGILEHFQRARICEPPRRVSLELLKGLAPRVRTRD